MQSKQKRLSFTICTSLTKEMFYLVHMEIWGPTVASLNGCRYFLTIVDDHTRFTWAIVTKNKSDVTVLIEQFYVMIKNTV